jgi:hypothetical protein
MSRSRCRLIFDRDRFDETKPVGYLFAVTLVSCELLEARVVRLKRSAGLPSKWMRDLIKVAGDPQPSRTPPRLSANASRDSTVE